MGIFMVGLYVLVATICVRWLSKYEGHYNSAFIFSVVAFAYGAGIPIELILREEDSVAITSIFTLTNITNDVNWIMYIMTMLSIPCFCMGYILSGFNALKPKNHEKAERHESLVENYLPFAMLALVLMSAFLISWKFSGVLAEANASYQASSELQYTNSVAFLLYYFVYVGIAVLAAALGVKQGAWGLLLSGLLWFSVVYLAFYSHERAPLALAALSMSYVFFHKMKGRGWLVAIAALGAMSLLFIVTPIFSMVRSGEFEAHELIPQLINGYGMSLKNLDPAGPLYSIVMHIVDSPPLQLGSTYISQLGVLVPRALWPDRPVDLSEAFAREYMADWTPGLGFGYSPYAEAVLNFGSYFAPLHFLIFGLIWGLYWRCAKFFLEFNNTKERLNGSVMSMSYDALYRVVGFYLILMFFRGTFIGVFKELTMTMVPLFAFCFMLYIAKWLLPQRTRPALGQFKPQ